MAPLAAHWRAQGIATLNVDYREVGDGGGWPGSFEDWQASAALIDQVAKDHPIDRARVTLVGHSAGALPTLWLPSAQNADGPTGERDAVKARAAIVFDGPADVGLERAAFDRLCRFSAVSPFMGGSPEEVPARYAALSPSNTEQQLAEVLFVQAVLPPPPDSAQAALGVDVVVATNQGASHFDVITPGSAVYDRNENAILKVLRSR
jgi:acetyl esterase/lipase